MIGFVMISLCILETTCHIGTNSLTLDDVENNYLDISSHSSYGSKTKPFIKTKPFRKRSYMLNDLKRILVLFGNHIDDEENLFNKRLNLFNRLRENSSNSMAYNVLQGNIRRLIG